MALNYEVTYYYKGALGASNVIISGHDVKFKASDVANMCLNALYQVNRRDYLPANYEVLSAALQGESDGAGKDIPEYFYVDCIIRNYDGGVKDIIIEDIEVAEDDFELLIEGAIQARYGNVDISKCVIKQITFKF